MMGATASLLGHLPALSPTDVLLFTVFCALAVHKIYNKFEVNPADFLASFILLVGVPFLPAYSLYAYLDSMTLSVIVAYSFFYVTLILSIIFYRISPMHPLAKYPGPLLLKISKFATMYYALRGKQYAYFKSLHDVYGPFVRVGPNEVSIVDVEAIPPVLGLDATRRGPQWIMHTKPGTTPHIVALRDVDKHRERRKLWNHGFTSAAIKEYQPVVTSRVLQLVEVLGKRESEETSENGVFVDLARWIAYFTYDFMGDLVFGGGFELMRNSDKNGIRPLLESNMKAVGTLEHVSWIARIITKLAAEPEALRNYREFGTTRFDMRKEQGATKRDLFHFITNEDKIEGIDVPRDQGLNEVFAAMVAGADSTSTVLAGLFFHVLSSPPIFAQLRFEVDTTFPIGEGEPADAVKLAAMPYLNAVINETLRLQPPLPTSLQRSPLENSGGKWVAGRFIPENTAIYIPPYVLHRDPRYFSPSPNEFIPERWLDKSASNEFTTNTAAFIPFSTGPAGCAGKNLALLEMRMVVATLIQKFDMRFATGYDPSKWEEEMQDFFTMKVGKLPVTLTARD